MLVQVSLNHTASGRRKKIVRKKKASVAFKEFRPTANPRLGENKYPSHAMVSGVAGRTGIMENLHKETEEVRQEILRKKHRLAPAFNKGAVQYITEEADPKHLGRKL